MSLHDPDNSQGKESHTSVESEANGSKRHGRWTLWGGILLGGIIILGLALGLGLGLGLKKHHRHNEDSRGGIKQIPRSQLVDPSQFTLSPSFDVKASPQTREFNWTLSEINSDPAGISKNMLVVNGISPGPTIEANIGDRVVVHITNNLSNASSIHWHGQNQNGTNFMDGTSGITECGIAPGHTFSYNWTVQNFGTYWWHAHYGTQYSDGLFGALILHSPNDTLRFTDPKVQSTPKDINSTYDGDLIFIVGDVYNTFSTVVMQSYLSPDGPDGTQGDEPVGDAGLVNGVGRSNCAFTPTGSTCDGGSDYNFTVEAGKRYRMRIINTGSLADIRFSVDGHILTVIEADATPVEPRRVQSVQVSVAQRYSVIIETDQKPSAYFVRGEVLKDMFAYDNPSLVTEQNAIMRYAGVPENTQPNDTITSLNGIAQDLDINSLVPTVPITPPTATRTETLFVTFEVTSQGSFGAFFNGSSWSAETNGNATVFQTAKAAALGTSWSSDSQFTITNDRVEVFDLIINNQDDGDHPFHLHGHTPWLMGTGEGNYQPGLANLSQANPMRRDTFVIPSYSWGIVRFVTDNPGLWALHCHLVWHMEAGLLMQFSNLPRNIASFPFPQGLLDQCNAIATTANS